MFSLLKNKNKKRVKYKKTNNNGTLLKKILLIIKFLINIFKKI